jgi:presenilin-like A22 family membrane protease
MKLKKLATLKPAYWSILIFVGAQIFTFGVISHQNVFLANNQIYVPIQPSPSVSLWPQPTTSASGVVTQTPVYSSLGPILIYFFVVVIVVGIVLSVIPISTLRIVLKAIFAFLFSWATFIILILWLPFSVTIGISVAVALSWFFFPKIWLHNLAMILAMVALGSLFGRLISPWTAMIVLLALSVYDFVAVRFGYMIWMVKKMSDSNTVPAFFIPKSLSEWRNSLKESSVSRLLEAQPPDRKYSLLGGGDIAFPLLLVSSVYFARGFHNAIIVAIFSLIGLGTAYWIQGKFLKGNPMPALPPIAVLSLIGLLILR